MIGAGRGAWLLAADGPYGDGRIDNMVLDPSVHRTMGIVVLDGWGAAIWSIVAESGPISAAQIVARLSEEAESLHDDIANDVEAFLVDLGQRGLVRC